MRCKIVNIDKEKGIVIHEYIDQIYLKAQISSSFDINCKAYDENNEIGMFDREAITLDDIYNHITKHQSGCRGQARHRLSNCYGDRHTGLLC